MQSDNTLKNEEPVEISQPALRFLEEYQLLEEYQPPHRERR
jgi:hypothetical protein